MWPCITYETYPWERNADEFELVPKSRRQKITATYEAALPAKIAQAPVNLPSELLVRMAELRGIIARFDQEQKARSYNLPALLLRSESSSSSQIERLTSSVRNVALAELSPKTPANAQLIASNVAAMRETIGRPAAISTQTICRIHDTLMRNTGEAPGFRTEQVWIGGTFYSPHGARFVPPHADRLNECLADLVEFGNRTDIDAIAKAALFHAQFETIHPFTDGNGRTGRALLHRMLANDEVLLHATLPASAGLLHDVASYMRALDEYHEGNIVPIVTCLADALELAVALGSQIAMDVDEVLCRWREATTERKGSATHRLPALLVEQPVVDVAYVARELDITDRAARNLIDAACKRGILAKMGNAQRGAFYQATDLLAILEEASSVAGIQRIVKR